MKLRRIYFTCLIGFLANIILFSQNEVISEQDRLMLDLKNAKHDTARLRIKCELGEIEPILRLTFWDSLKVECLSLIEKQQKGNAVYKVYQTQLVSILNNVGFMYSQQSNNKAAIEYYNKAVKIAEEINDKKSLATSYNNLGGLYVDIGEISKSFEYHNKSVKIREELNDKPGMAESYGHLGGFYGNVGNKAKALEYFLLSLKIREEVCNINKTNKSLSSLAYALNNIGQLYYESGEESKGMEYLDRSLKILESIKDKYGLASILNTFGAIYNSEGNYKRANEYIQRSLKLKKEIGDKEGMAYAYLSIGKLNYNQVIIKKDLINKVWADSMLNLAYHNYLLSLEISEQINDKDAISSVLIEMSQTLIRRQKTDEALKCLTRALSLSKELGYPINIANASLILYDIYKKQNKLALALEMYELNVKMQGKVNSAESRQAITALQYKYDFDKFEIGLKAEQEKTEIRHAEETKQHKLIIWFVIVGLLIVILFSVFLFNRFRVTQKQKHIIEDQKLKVDQAYDELHEKNKEVLDSITYARRIQRSLLTSEKYIDKHLNKLNKD